MYTPLIATAPKPGERAPGIPSALSSAASVSVLSFPCQPLNLIIRQHLLPPAPAPRGALPLTSPTH